MSLFSGVDPEPAASWIIFLYPDPSSGPLFMCTHTLASLNCQSAMYVIPDPKQHQHLQVVLNTFTAHLNSNFSFNKNVNIIVMYKQLRKSSKMSLFPGAVDPEPSGS